MEQHIRFIYENKKLLNDNNYNLNDFIKYHIDKAINKLNDLININDRFKPDRDKNCHILINILSSIKINLI